MVFFLSFLSDQSRGDCVLLNQTIMWSALNLRPPASGIHSLTILKTFISLKKVAKVCLFLNGFISP